MLRGELAGGPDEDEEPAGIAARSTSLKDRGVAPPPGFPDGGVSRHQCWALLRPVAVAGRGLDSGRREGEVVAGLGMRAGMGLVGLGVASRHKAL